MTTTPLRSRLAWLSLFVLQLFAVGVVPVLDAGAEGAAYGAVAHVEEPGRSDCPLGHEPDECQLCRVLRSAGPPVEPPGLAAVDRVVAPPVWEGAERAPVGGAGLSARPRAPPA
jgi:hypothetical protein